MRIIRRSGVKEIRGKSGVMAVDVVTGPHHIIATIQANTTEHIAKTVLMDIVEIPGVKQTTTYGVISLEQPVPEMSG